MREKYSQKLSTSQYDCAMSEVCDICGDIGIADDILICPKCKISREHGYCRKIYPNNRTDDWLCDECEGKCSSKNLGKDVHTKLASSSSGCINNKPAHSSLDGKYRRDKIAMKRKVKNIASPEVIMLSSISKRVNVPVKTVKLINKSSSESAEPMRTSTSSYRKGLYLNSPMKSVPLPCKRPIDSVAQRQGRRGMQSSSSKRADVPVKAIKQINKSSTRTAEPMGTSTSSYRNGLHLNSPKKSVPLPCKRPINSVAQQQGRRGMQSSSSKRVDVPVKAIKQIKKSSTRIAEPMGTSTSNYRKGLHLNSPMKSVPLPCKRPINSVAQRQGSRGLQSSSSKRVDVPVKTIKQLNKSSARIAEPMGTSTSSCRKGLSLNSPMKSGPLPCKKPINSGVQQQSDRIMLSSSSKGVDAPVNKKINKSSSKIAEPMCTRTSSCREGLSLNSPMAMESVPLPCKRPINSVVQGQSSRMLHVAKVTRSVQAIIKELVQMAESVANMESAGNQDANLIKKTSIEGEAMSAPAPDNQFLQPVNSDHEVNDDSFPLFTDIENCKPTDAELRDERFSHVPARYPTWKGQFEIQGENFNYRSSGYMAFPRARSLLSVFEFSQRMPAILQFELTPRKDIWRVFFPDDCAGEGDIGLYFYSAENKRDSDDDFLIKFIEDHDFVMRCDLTEVELYLFSSKLLPAAYQRLFGEYYFWGVFVRSKSL